MPAPDPDPHAAPRAKRAPGLGECGDSIGEELQPVLTNRDVELGVGDGQMIGRGQGVLDRRCIAQGWFGSGDREHRRAQVDADHATAATDRRRREPCHRSGTARNVDDPLGRLEVEPVEKQPCARGEEPRDEHVVVDPRG